VTNLINVVDQLRKERQNVQQQVQRLDDVISALEGFGGRNRFRSGHSGPRHMSAAARSRIAATQKARWARWHRQHGTAGKANGKGRAKRVISAASRRKMAAAQRARWAKARKSS